jgi:hypothetical protein
MMGGDMPKNDDFTLRLLTNAPLLAIQKESWCAHPVLTTEDASVWLAPRKDGKGCYAAAFNLSDEPRTVSVPSEALEGLHGKATELWTGLETALPLSADLPPHDAAVWRINP